MLYALNLHSDAYQFFFNKTGKTDFYLVNWKGHKANFNKFQINKNK